MAFNGELGHVGEIESPWGNAGGVVKTLEDVEQMAHTGVGWIEAGSYTLEPRLGNAWNPETEQFDRTVYYHNPETGETYNSLGMPNKGMDEVEAEIPEMVRIADAHNKKLLVNVAPVSDEPVEESIELVRRAYEAGAHGVVLNAGCPNVLTADGGRHELLSRSPQSFFSVIGGLAIVQTPIMVRISPQESRANAKRILMAATTYEHVSAVFDPNTWPGHKPVDGEGNPILDVPGGMGGKSGPAMDHEAAEETAWAVGLVGDSVDIISSSSIMNAKTLQRRLDLGAVAGAGTTFFYESRNGWKEDVDRMLQDLAA